VNLFRAAALQDQPFPLHFVTFREDHRPIARKDEWVVLEVNVHTFKLLLRDGTMAIKIFVKSRGQRQPRLIIHVCVLA